MIFKTLFVPLFYNSHNMNTYNITWNEKGHKMLYKRLLTKEAGNIGQDLIIKRVLRLYTKTGDEVDALYPVYKKDLSVKIGDYLISNICFTL